MNWQTAELSIKLNCLEVDHFFRLMQNFSPINNITDSLLFTKILHNWIPTATVSIRDSTDLFLQSRNTSRQRHKSSQSKYDLVTESTLTIPALTMWTHTQHQKPKFHWRLNLDALNSFMNLQCQMTYVANNEHVQSQILADVNTVPDKLRSVTNLWQNTH